MSSLQAVGILILFPLNRDKLTHGQTSQLHFSVSSSKQAIEIIADEIFFIYRYCTCYRR